MNFRDGDDGPRFRVRDKGQGKQQITFKPREGETLKGVCISSPAISQCCFCGMWHSLELRRTEDGTLRDQPRCPPCRREKKKKQSDDLSR